MQLTGLVLWSLIQELEGMLGLQFLYPLFNGGGNNLLTLQAPPMGLKQLREIGVMDLKLVISGHQDPSSAESSTIGFSGLL